MRSKQDLKQDYADFFEVPHRLKQLLVNFEAVAANDPTAVVVDTDGRTPDQLADEVLKYAEGPVLNTINTDAVIRDDGAHGHFPTEIHEAVDWWIGACLVTTLKAHQIAVAHDGRVTSLLVHQRLCRGAINARHYACTVLTLRVAE
ncbi:hypothetical protein ACFXOD_25410 [Streptomyces sp. NPDC059161]|uniref:hypothetical protein n=1 Tax=Streptomyces sp. NPDC059161 TaxID=3346749 RepID=UPI0036A9F57B